MLLQVGVDPCPGSVSDGSVGDLAQDVEVAVVSRVLLDQVEQDPPQRGHTPDLTGRADRSSRSCSATIASVRWAWAR